MRQILTELITLLILKIRNIGCLLRIRILLVCKLPAIPRALQLVQSVEYVVLIGVFADDHVDNATVAFLDGGDDLVSLGVVMPLLLSKSLIPRVLPQCKEPPLLAAPIRINVNHHL